MEKVNKQNNNLYAFITSIIKGVLITLPLVQNCLATEFYVDINKGVDTNSGTIDHPFKTIDKAVSKVGAGDIVFLREGTYRETITVNKSGTESKPIIFKAYSSENAKISSTSPVKSSSSIASMRAMATWFCDAYASWQKGGVENANGRLRRWLPRDIDLDALSDQDIQEIAVTANLTPRKCLGYKTPFQAILAELGRDVEIRFA